MAQLMPLPLTVSCFSKIQVGFIFWYRLTQVVLDKRAVKCVSLSLSLSRLQADCQVPGSAPEPYAPESSMGYLYF